MTKVLVVDGDNDILTIVRIILQMHHFNVVCLKTTVQLMEQLEGIRPDVILLDANPHVSDGRFTCKAIKESGLYNDTSIILFTSDKRYAADAKKYLFDDCIEKPFDLEELVQKLISIQSSMFTMKCN